MTDSSTNPIDLIDSITLWFEKAIPNPKEKNFTTQLGVHIEEFAEMLDTLLPALKDSRQRLAVANLTAQVIELSVAFKKSQLKVDFSEVNRVEFLDALCDQVVTATGTAYTARMDFFSALDEVDHSNWSKFDDSGNPLFDENKKIIKGPNYRRAELSQFV